MGSQASPYCYVRKFGNHMLQQLVNGLILGSVYALLALGYTMVYGIIRLINFAHGDLYMMGAFIGYYLINAFHLNIFVALVLTMLITSSLGVLIEFLAYRVLAQFHPDSCTNYRYRGILLTRIHHGLFCWCRSSCLSASLENR